MEYYYLLNNELKILLWKDGKMQNITDPTLLPQNTIIHKKIEIDTNITKKFQIQYLNDLAKGENVTQFSVDHYNFGKIVPYILTKTPDVKMLYEYTKYTLTGDDYTRDPIAPESIQVRINDGSYPKYIYDPTILPIAFYCINDEDLQTVIKEAAIIKTLPYILSEKSKEQPWEEFLSPFIIPELIVLEPDLIEPTAIILPEKEPNYFRYDTQSPIIYSDVPTSEFTQGYYPRQITKQHLYNITTRTHNLVSIDNDIQTLFFYQLVSEITFASQYKDILFLNFVPMGGYLGSRNQQWPDFPLIYNNYKYIDFNFFDQDKLELVWSDIPSWFQFYFYLSYPDREKLTNVSQHTKDLYNAVTTRDSETYYDILQDHFKTLLV